MSFQSIPKEANRFIAEYITSVAQLELLLLLRTDQERAWTADHLARELRVDPAWAQLQLEAMAGTGLLKRGADPESGFQYGPGSPEVEHSLTVVAQAYIVNRVSIIELIYNKPGGENLRAFADAFRLRKDPPRD
jgi:hypothetical protein